MRFVIDISKFDSLGGFSIEIRSDFVEQKQTLRELMKVSIQLHLRKLSFSHIIPSLESFGVERVRSTVYKDDLQPTAGKQPDHVAVDKTVIHLNDQRYWLYATSNPEMNRFLHVWPFPTQNDGVTSIFFTELTEKHDVKNAVFLIDSGL